MANIKFSRKEFEKDIGKLDEDMQQKIAMFGTTLESFDNEEIEIEVFPNRPDLLSYQGFKRSFLAFLGKGTGLKQYKINKPEKDYTVNIDKSVKEVRPFTTCAIVKNLKFDDEKIKEIIDIQEKLHSTFGRNRKKIAIGIYPLEKIKLPIVYRAEHPDKIKFVPLEMNQEMTGKQILSRHPAGCDYAHLLEGEKKFPIFVDSKEEILSMPPIINSQMTGKITSETKEIFIECSGFDLSAQQKTLNILVIALADMNGEVYAMQLNYGNKKIITPDLTSEKVKINLENVSKLLGLQLGEQEVKKLLEKMGHSYSKGMVEVPAYRTDILHEVDLAEDIAIAYGYDNFKPEIPKISTIGGEDETAIRKRKIAEILVGLGLLEVSTYHLTNKKDIKKMGIKGKSLEVLESKTDYNILRPSLLVNFLKILGENIDAKYPQKIFELGKVFEGVEKINEKEKLAVALSGETDFTEIKQILDYLMKMLNREYRIEETEHPCFIKGRCGKIIVNGKELGVLGEVSPYVIKNWRLKMPAVALEMEIEED
jgi:phenylalanyl-tRNA synthetase beta chain